MIAHVRLDGATADRYRVGIRRIARRHVTNGAFIRVVCADVVGSCSWTWVRGGGVHRPQPKRKENTSKEGENRCTDPAKPLRPVGNRQ
jgi:hypothetical protein